MRLTTNQVLEVWLTWTMPNSNEKYLLGIYNSYSIYILCPTSGNFFRTHHPVEETISSSESNDNNNNEEKEEEEGRREKKTNACLSVYSFDGYEDPKNFTLSVFNKCVRLITEFKIPVHRCRNMRPQEMWPKLP